MLERSEGFADWTRHHIREIQGIHSHVSERPTDQSTRLGYPSHLDCRYRSRNQKTTTPSSVDYMWKLCFYVGTMQRICFFSDDFYSDSTLILTTIAVKQCRDIGARSHVCGVLLVFLIFVLILADGLCCAWFIYPILFWYWCPETGTSSNDWDELNRFHLKTETDSSLRKHCVLNINMRMDKVQKHTYCIKLTLSQDVSVKFQKVAHL
jgi:hypothetical protein